MFCSRHILFLSLVALTSIPYGIVSLDNGLARTPPMGWINWERFTCQVDCDNYPEDCVNEKLFKEIIDHLVDDGYRELGYEYVNIDDCWSEFVRDSDTDELIPDHKRFPNGITGLTKYAHDRDVKLGIYGDCGTKTCAGYPSQLKDEQNLEDNYFSVDSETFAKWEVDSFKFDGCNLDPSKAESICPKWSLALNRTNRPVLVVCEWPFYMLKESHKPNYTLAQKACNAWRYYDDVEDAWLSILSIIDFTTRMQRTMVQYHGPGHWFDPDQLIIGNFALSLDQARAQMAIWSIWSAPLYMSNDLRSIPADMAAILKNKNLIAVDQDRMGVLGVLVRQAGERNSLQAFVKPIEPIINGCPSFAIVYLNRNTLGNRVSVSFPLRELLSNSALNKAEERNRQLNGGQFSAESCRRRLLLSMTKEPIPDELVEKPAHLKDDKPIEEQSVTYMMYDLYNDKLESTKINLNEDLGLEVNPSGVRVVRLTEQT